MANNYDDSEYFSRLQRVFGNLPDDNTKRAFAAAVIECFSVEEGRPKSPAVIARGHGFNAKKCHQYRFVLAKAHAIGFFIRDAEMPDVSRSDIRDVTIAEYKKCFEREPFVRGRSSYWLTMAEWIKLLDIAGEIALPSELARYARREKLM